MLIVSFTGVQKSGKTSLVESTCKALQADGRYNVMVVPEIATSLLYLGKHYKDKFEFQVDILNQNIISNYNANHRISEYEQDNLDNLVVLVDDLPSTGIAYLDNLENRCDWMHLYAKAMDKMQDQTYCVYDSDINFYLERINFGNEKLGNQFRIERCHNEILKITEELDSIYYDSVKVSSSMNLLERTDFVKDTIDKMLLKHDE